jgi:ABC-type glycerol-3-phosphate transport system substrate-binding protein
MCHGTEEVSMAKNKRLIVVVLSLTMMLVASASFAAGAVEESDEVVELTVWFGRQNFIPADNFQSFHEEYPNIRVTTDVIPLETAVADTLRAARSGQAADIIQPFNYDSQPLADADLLLDISDQMERWQEEDPESYSNIASWGFTMGGVDGVPVGLGIHGGSRYLVYRNDLLEKHGLSVPQSWDDLLDAARTIVDAEDGVYGFSLFGARGSNPSTELQIFFSMGGVWENHSVPQIDSPAGYYLIEFYQTLARDGLLHPETIAWGSGEQRSAFIDGNAAFMMMGENIMPTLAESREYGVGWDVTAPPYRPGARNERRIPVIGFPMFVISQTEHPYEASLILRYLAQKENAMEVASRYQPTSNTAAMTSPEFLEIQPWRTALAPFEEELFPYPAMANAEQSFDILKDLREEMMTNLDESPESIAARYQERLNAAAAE